jgi:hypothetical protein
VLRATIRDVEHGIAVLPREPQDPVGRRPGALAQSAVLSLLAAKHRAHLVPGASGRGKDGSAPLAVLVAVVQGNRLSHGTRRCIRGAV